MNLRARAKSRDDQEREGQLIPYLSRADAPSCASITRNARDSIVARSDTSFAFQEFQFDRRCSRKFLNRAGEQRGMSAHPNLREFPSVNDHLGERRHKVRVEAGLRLVEGNQGRRSGAEQRGGPTEKL